MHIIIWEYHVKAERTIDFENIYASNGAWAELFKMGTGYLGTELLYHITNPQHYLTIDRWHSKENYEGFLIQYENEYKVLDAECADLTERESLLGTWIST